MNEIKAAAILVVDDENNVVESYKTILEDEYTIDTAFRGKEAVEKVKKARYEIVFLDIMMPGMDGMETLRLIKQASSETDVVMVTAVKDVKTAIQAMKLGAYDYITKPFDVDEILSTARKITEKQKLEREVTYLREEQARPAYFNSIIGDSEPMKQVYELINEMGKNNTTVTIYGESGTGKELVARALHYNGARKDKPFVAVDCAAIPDNLLESELFGHEKGSFTDASSQKTGKFELAGDGTLFLDEIGNLKLDMQAKILRALQEREIQRVGGSRNIKVESRIICATNVNLKEAVDNKKFREDLLYRINVVPIHLPALRDRKTDIPLFIAHFLKVYNAKFQKNIKGVSETALKLMMNYAWPGNVRELQNVMERLVVLGRERVIQHRQLPLEIMISGSRINSSEKVKISLKSTTGEFEKKYLIGILEKVNWNQTKAAKILKVHRNTIINKIRNLNIKTP